MIDRKHFFDTLKKSLVNSFTASQLEGFNSILDEYDSKPFDKRYLAYMLGTVYHETAKTMQPIAEYGKGKGKPYGKMIKMNGKMYDFPIQLYYGRGFVQLTWYENYVKAGKKLGIDLLNNPDLALTMNVAVKILFQGMLQGWFTGRKLSDYIGSKTDYVGARKIINGTDKASLIASYANAFFVAIG